jgi:hypothetical protein
MNKMSKKWSSFEKQQLLTENFREWLSEDDVQLVYEAPEKAKEIIKQAEEVSNTPEGQKVIDMALDDPKAQALMDQIFQELEAKRGGIQELGGAQGRKDDIALATTFVATTAAIPLYLDIMGTSAFAALAGVVSGPVAAIGLMGGGIAASMALAIAVQNYIEKKKKAPASAEPEVSAIPSVPSFTDDAE